MKKITLLLITLCSMFQIASAQFEAAHGSEVGKPVKFLNTIQSGRVIMYHSCDPRVIYADMDIIMGTDDRCLVVPTNGALASAQFNDIGRVTLGANAADNILYLVANHNMSYQVMNNNSSTLPGSLMYVPGITIESVALNDPQAIDPFTGLPMNGSFTLTSGLGTRSFARPYASGVFENITDSFTRANTTGLSRAYFLSLGLPRSVVNNLFNNPMTLKLNLRVSGKLISIGQFSYGIRALGN